MNSARGSPRSSRMRPLLHLGAQRLQSFRARFGLSSTHADDGAVAHLVRRRSGDAPVRSRGRARDRRTHPRRQHAPRGRSRRARARGRSRSDRRVRQLGERVSLGGERAGRRGTGAGMVLRARQSEGRRCGGAPARRAGRVSLVPRGARRPIRAPAERERGAAGGRADRARRGGAPPDDRGAHLGRGCVVLDVLPHHDLETPNARPACARRCSSCAPRRRSTSRRCAPPNPSCSVAPRRSGRCRPSRREAGSATA